MAKRAPPRKPPRKPTLFVKGQAPKFSRQREKVPKEKIR